MEGRRRRLAGDRRDRRAARRPRQADDVHEPVRRRGGAALQEARRRTGGSGGPPRRPRSPGRSGEAEARWRDGRAQRIALPQGTPRDPRVSPDPRGDRTAPRGDRPGRLRPDPPAPEILGAFDAAVAAAGEAFADIVRLGFDKAMARWNAKARDAAPGKAPPESPGGNILLAPGASSGGSISRKEARSPDDTEEV